jgi:hypothetical protein
MVPGGHLWATGCRVAPTIFLATALGVQATFSVFSKAITPSGVVWHNSPQLPASFRLMLSKSMLYPNPTAWLPASLGRELAALMDKLTPKQLVRNFLMGKYIRAHMSGLAQPQECKKARVQGLGLLIQTDLTLSQGRGGVSMGIKRLLPQLNVTAAQVESHIKLANPRSFRGKKAIDERNLELGMIQSELHGLVERARTLDIEL